MNKIKEMMKKRKNNKGFSLVELIVVIAIMVVLVAVLGSTILGYVDKSKYSKDIQALDSLKTAVSSYVADPKCNYTSGTQYTLDQLMTKTADPNSVIANTLAEVFNISKDADGNVDGDASKFNNASAAFADLYLNEVKVIITNGAVSIRVEATDAEPYTVGTATFSS